MHLGQLAPVQESRDMIPAIVAAVDFHHLGGSVLQVKMQAEGAALISQLSFAVVPYAVETKHLHTPNQPCLPLCKYQPLVCSGVWQ